MDIFRRCVEDLSAIDRLLELPHGYEIAIRMFDEIRPFVQLLDAMKQRDPSGAIVRLVAFAADIGRRIDSEKERITGELLLA